MALAAPSKLKINTKTTQPACDSAARHHGGGKTSRAARGPARVGGDTRESVRGSGRPVVELECGITVYPPQQDGDPWRAVFVENGQRRYREAVTEDKLAAKLEKVTEWLTADAPNMERPLATVDMSWKNLAGHGPRTLATRPMQHQQRIPGTDTAAGFRC